jgi:hypothetical protein
VRAIDKAGNTGSAASRQFTIAAPTTGDDTTGGTTGGGTKVDRTAPVLKVAGGTLRVSRRGTFAVTLRCPSAETWCKADVKILRGGVVVARNQLKLAGGKKAGVTLRLTKAARRALAARGRVRVTARVVARDKAGNHATRSSKLTLLAPRG